MVLTYDHQGRGNFEVISESNCKCLDFYHLASGGKLSYLLQHNLSFFLLDLRQNQTQANAKEKEPFPHKL